jgi:hypothetical protein
MDISKFLHTAGMDISFRIEKEDQKELRQAGKKEKNLNWVSNRWVSVKWAARLMKVSESAISKRCSPSSKNPLVYRELAKGGISIRLSSLTQKAIKRYKEEELPGIRSSKTKKESPAFKALYRASTSQKQKFCNDWTEALHYFAGYRGSNHMKSIIKTWNASHELQLSYSRLQAMRKKFRDNDGDRSFLLKERRIPQSTIKKEWFEDFKIAYSLQKRNSVEKARLESLSLAQKRGEDVNEDNFPSASSFHRVLSKLKACQEKKYPDEFVKPLSKEEIVEVRHLLRRFRSTTNAH